MRKLTYRTVDREALCRDLDDVLADAAIRPVGIEVDDSGLPSFILLSRGEYEALMRFCNGRIRELLDDEQFASGLTSPTRIE
ncbi:hypothetical protein [Qipengyuania qiaonensis]|uniref:Type II toxin-antitoxin system Phd/YefM family antitoxin n=1 Tax=Qipengyuania qiaonensis TaxID=2867240 RepID=A0ABS7J923_9SPHN|nr:hypothetical protein [Qipengyuania qiaonensis]MBX7483819.1 hypothetical protein [Qipengyuania qiaonensis]